MSPAHRHKGLNNLIHLDLFFFNYYYFFSYVYKYGYVGECAHGVQKGASDLLSVAGVKGSCEQPGRGAGNRTQVLSSMSSLH